MNMFNQPKEKRAYTKKSETTNNTQEKPVIGKNLTTAINGSFVECCRTCDFVRNHICKRYPPMIGNTAFIQPIVLDTDWCGCYKRAGK